MQKVLLENYFEDIKKGDICHCKSTLTLYEAYVDFLVIDMSVYSDRVHALIVASGYKGGLMGSLLPNESLNKEKNGIDINWFKEYGPSWIMPDLKKEDVFIIPSINSLN